MRLCRLELARFGHFTDFTLDLGPGDGTDFHIILGPNEAGKSTLVQAWLSFLYGIPAKTSYDFRHARNTLMIGATLEDDGVPLILTRTPQRANNLLSADGTVVASAVLDGLLRGVGRDAYTALYCLDDETIERGGEDILASQGDLGRLLFSAASGLETFNTDLEEQRAEDRAFQRQGPGKQSTTVMVAKKTIADLERALKEVDLSAADYRKLRIAAEDAAREDEAMRERFRALTEMMNSLRARLNAQPLLADLRDLQARLTQTGDPPEVAPGTKARFAELAQGRDRLTGKVQARRTELERLELELESLHIDPAADGLSRKLEEIGNQRERFGGDAQDLPRRRAEADEHRIAAKRLVTELGLPDLALETTTLPRPALEELDRTDRTHQAAVTDLARARAEHRQAIEVMQRAQSEIDALRTVDDDREALRSILRRGDAPALADTYAESLRVLVDAERKAADALDALSIGSVTFGACPEVLVTTDAVLKLAEQINKTQSTLKAEETELEQVRSRHTRLRARGEELEKQVLEIGDERADLLRAERAALWDRHRAALNKETADAFAEALAAEDRLTALRLSGAAHLAEARQLALERAEADAALHLAHAAVKRAQSALEAAVQRLSEHLAEIGLPEGLSAPEFAKWLTLHGHAVTAGRVADHARLAVAEAKKAAGPVLEALGQIVNLPISDPVGLVRTATQQLSILEKSATARESAERRLTEATKDVERRASVVTQAEQAVSAAQDSVALALAALDLPPGTGTQASALLPVLRDLAQECNDLRKVSDRIEKLEQNAVTFAETIRAIAAPWPDLADLPPAEVSTRLDEIVTTDRETRDLRARITRDIAAARDQITADQRRLTEIDAEAAALAAPLNLQTSEFSQLRSAITLAVEAADLRTQIGKTETRLTATLGVQTVDEAKTMLASETESSLTTKLDNLKPELTAAEDQHRLAIAARAKAEAALAGVAGDDDAAQLAQDRETELEGLRAVAQSGMARRVALLLADRALARYRERHRSAMLSDTAEDFAHLTGGAYPTLGVQPGEKGDILIAQRANGDSLRADALSKGTRFQLYLALRLAGYRQMAASGTVLPFLCDDIFETFDEARTAAACRLMGEIAEVGQALYFTHHAHVVDIAQSVCGKSVKVHRI